MPETFRNLTLFFDSTCPLCVGEMQHLRKLDTENRLSFEDIHVSDFTERFPDIEPSKAANVFHGQYENGDMVYGPVSYTHLTLPTIYSV